MNKDKEELISSLDKDGLDYLNFFRELLKIKLVGGIITIGDHIPLRNVIIKILKMEFPSAIIYGQKTLNDINEERR